MKKADFVSIVAEKSNLSKKDTQEVIDKAFETIEDLLANGDSISFLKFGSFSVATRAAREGKVPGTDKTYSKPETKVVKFKVGKQLKDRVSLGK